MASKFSKSLKGSPKIKNGPAAKAAKVEIRRNVLEVCGRDSFVFDAFAGAGEMYRAIWREAGGYVGADLEWTRDARLAYVCDNRRVLRAVDLKPYSIFDLDSFGSPWEQALIIAARRPVAAAERIGFILTEGSGLKPKFGGMANALAELAGLHGKVSGLWANNGDLIDKAIAGLADRMHCSVERRWEAKGRTGASMRYIGFVLRGNEGLARDVA